MTQTSKATSHTPRKYQNNYVVFAKEMFIFLFMCWRILVDWTIDLFLGYIFKKEVGKRLPSVHDSIVLKSATTLAEQIRQKQITSEEVVRAYIERIKEVNPLINAVVDTRYEEAIQEAQAVDRFLAETDQSTEDIKARQPFLGVPFTSKEATAAKGMSWTFGLVSRSGIRADFDASVVQLMKDSGAILIAVTNVPELAMWCETRNNIHGQTNNPYYFSKTAGGSSGGEGAIVTACGSPLGLGNDIGGSIRIPAYYNGIFGHKPTPGTINTKGLMTRTGDEGSGTMLSIGPMARFVEDLTPMLKVLLGDQVKFYSLDKKVNVEEIKIYYCVSPKDLLLSPVSNEVITTIMKAVDHLATVSKHHVDKISLDGFRHCCTLWQHEITKEPEDFSYELSNRKGKVTLSSVLPKFLLGKSEFTLPSVLLLVNMKITQLADNKWAEENINKLKKELLDLLGDNGVLLFPNAPTTAHYHYASYFRPFNFAYWGIFNALRLPVTQVPLGLSKSGLPLGLQVVAGPYNDHLTIAVAAELERAFGGWVPPFSV